MRERDNRRLDNALDGTHLIGIVVILRDFLEISDFCENALCIIKNYVGAIK